MFRQQDSGTAISDFKKKSQTILDDLIKLINIKSYCLDQALWYFAERSKSIPKFFKSARIKGEFSLATYIDYYLKNVDEELSMDAKEIRLLKQAMKDLRKYR